MRSLREREAEVIWHPFTQSGMEVTPLSVVAAEGSNLILEDGRKIIDGISSWWCNTHGHGHPELVKAAAKQFATLDHVMFAGFTHEPAVALAEALLKVLPQGFAKVFFSDNGSTACEVALKLALQFWSNQGLSKRRRIIALDGGYHGDTFGAMAVGARGPFSAPFDSMLFEVERVSIDDGEAALAHMRSLCESEEIAAFIFEPLVQGAGGMRMYDAALLDSYMAIAHEYGVLSIADEVMTGFGRTGALFASESLLLSPDIICLSKGLTAGSLPLAVTVCTQEIFERFISSDHSRTFFHGHTYTANPIACAVALVALNLTVAPECEAARKRIEHLHREAAEELSRIGYIENARVCGTILAFDLNMGDVPGYMSNIARQAFQFFIERGLLIRPLGNVVYCMPPYCITEGELASIYHAMRDFCAAR